MLEARPIGIFSQDFDIEVEGQKIAMLDVSCWMEAGAISLEGQLYRLYREGVMRGSFVLKNQQGEAVARAIKPSAFRSQFDLEFGDRHCSLKRASAFGRSFSVFQDGVIVGSIRPAGVFTRRTMINLPADWSTPIQVFVFWLVLVIWNRDDAGGVAAAGVAAAAAAS